MKSVFLQIGSKYSLGTGHKVQGVGRVEIGMGHLNIGPVYRVGQVEIEQSSKTSLFQETEGENLPRE